MGSLVGGATVLLATQQPHLKRRGNRHPSRRTETGLPVYWGKQYIGWADEHGAVHVGWSDETPCSATL